MAIEIVDFPIENGGSFQFAMLNYQRVSFFVHLARISCWSLGISQILLDFLVEKHIAARRCTKAESWCTAFLESWFILGESSPNGLEIQISELFFHLPIYIYMVYLWKYLWKYLFHLPRCMFIMVHDLLVRIKRRVAGWVAGGCWDDY